ncbi:MAG: SelL-related redox protein [Tepidisphaeraceae bacterium]
MDRVASELLDRPLTGLRLSGQTFRDELARTPQTLLVFLRYFGCIFCKEMVKDARAAASLPGYPRVLVFCQAGPEEAAEFFAKYWPEATVVCDPSKVFYDAFDLGHGTYMQMFGPRVWVCGIRAVSKRNMQGIPRKGLGDPWTMPGVFLADTKGKIVWHHEFQHAGDHPDFKSIPQSVTVV